MYKKILVPLDGSRSAEAVLPFVRALAGKWQFAVKLLGVVDTVELARGLATAERFYMNSLVADETQRISEYLATVEKKLSGPPVTSTVEEGRAAELIIESAAAEKTTLIAMATHGRSGLNRWLLGSVAEKVLRGTANPLVLIRSTENAQLAGAADLKSVIVPLDGSELAESVLPSVVDLAQSLDLEIFLLRAYAIPYEIGRASCRERVCQYV